MTASAKKSSSTTRTRAATVDRLALIRAKAEERAAAKAEREAFKAHLDRKAEAEDAEALTKCHIILDRMAIRGAKARAARPTEGVLGSRKRARLARPAALIGRDAEIQTATKLLPAAYAPGRYDEVTFNRRVDVLQTERSAGRISEADFIVGRMIHAVYERASGARLGSTDWASGGSRDMTIALELNIILSIDDAERVQKFTARLERAIGAVGTRFLRAILAEGQTFAAYAAARGKGGDRGTAQVAAHFRFLLAGLTEDQHTARAPGAAPARDEYAAQADAVPERLERSAIFVANHDIG